MIEHFLLRIACIIVWLLPKRYAYWIGVKTANLWFMFPSRWSKSLIENLRQISGGKWTNERLVACARANFEHFAMYLVDFLGSIRLTKKEIMDSVVSVEGRERLHQVIAKGRGVVVTTGHIGNWELAGSVFVAVAGKPVVTVALAHKRKGANEIFLRRRREKGMEVVPPGFALKRCYQALRSGGIIAMLGDRSIGSSINVPFFGRLTNMPKGPAEFSIKTGAPILPIFAVKENSRFKLFVEEPIWPGKGKDELRRIVRKCVDVLELYIRRYPEQWFMYYPVWE